MDAYTQSLLQLFDSPDYAGVYSITHAQQAALQQAAEDAGVSVRRIDLHSAIDKAAALQKIADALAFSPDFGHNWDALADALNDLSWLPDAERGHALLLEGFAPLRQHGGDALSTLYSIGLDVSANWRVHGIGFWMIFINN